MIIVRACPEAQLDYSNYLTIAARLLAVLTSPYKQYFLKREDQSYFYGFMSALI